jgi:GntP family gluconate:H+ symporter
MATALSATHGFLPPHPAPTAISVALDANPGKVLVFGLIISIVAAVIAGPLFTKVMKKITPNLFTVKKELTAFGEIKEFKLEETPSFAISTLTSLFPVILMAIATAWGIIRFGGDIPADVTGIDAVIDMIGNPVIAILISLIVSLFTMGYGRKRTFKEIASSIEESTRSIAGLLLVIGGGAAFKQVLIDGGVGDAVAAIFQDATLSPIILAWIITVILRIALGSATVAALTSAGLVMPLMQSAGIDPTFMVLAIGAGSLACSHVNDAGFWMFKEYFDLDIKQTFQTWTMLETIISVVGLGMALLLNVIFG